MPTKNTPDDTGDDEFGVLGDAVPVDTASIDILGATAQVSVELPQDDDDSDDDVVADEVIEMLADVPAAATASDEREVLRPAAETSARDAVVEADARGEADAGEGAVVADDVVDAAADETPERPESGTVPDAGHAPEVASVPDAGQDDLASLGAEAESPGEPEPEPEPEPAAEAEPAPQADPAPPVSRKKIGTIPVSPALPVHPPAHLGARTPVAPRPRGTLEPEVAERLRRTVSDRSAAEPADAPAPSAARTPAENTAPTATPAPAAAPTVAQETPAREEPAPAASVPAAKRLDEITGPAPETSELLTADRLLDAARIAKAEPEGAWSHFLYTVSGRRINIGDGRRARERKALSARIAAPLTGGARFVPVLSRKGGVGKTAVAALLGMALADSRDDRVIAVDANPDRGTLADRIRRTHTKSIRDLVRIHDQVRGYNDVSAIVARDATRLDVLASDSDPRVAEAFSDEDYRHVASVAEHYYSMVLTDTGTGIVHSVMTATLERADAVVIVSGVSVDEARLASETLTWLEANGHADLARSAIVVLNQSVPGKPLVRLDQLETHFASRVRHVARMPYDAQIAGGGPMEFASLQPETRLAARELAALVVEVLRAEER